MKQKIPRRQTKRTFGHNSKLHKGVKRVIVLPDTQIPYEDKQTCKAVFKYIKDFQPDEIIQLGDFLDFDCISHWQKGNERIINKKLRKEYVAGNEFLDQLQSVAPKSKIVIIQGNHDQRIEKYLDANPAGEGYLEFETCLKLKERGIKFVKFWDKGTTYKIGHATFIHGLYTGDQHAKKHVQQYGTNIFYGHLHDIQNYSQVHKGDNKTLVGQSLGCLCEYNQSYMKGKPSRWQQGFGVFYFQPNGFFNYYVVRIFNHSFVSPEGNFYQP